MVSTGVHAMLCGAAHQRGGIDDRWWLGWRRQNPSRRKRQKNGPEDECTGGHQGWCGLLLRRRGAPCGSPRYRSFFQGEAATSCPVLPSQVVLAVAGLLLMTN